MDSRPWLKNYPARWNLEYPRISLYHYLKQAADQVPGRIALVFMGIEVTYKEMMDNIDRVAAAFTGLGLVKGDRIALMLPNCFAYVYCYYAAMRLGLVVVQVNPLYTARELNFIVRDSGARILIALDMIYPTIEQAVLERDLENLVIVPLTGESITGRCIFFDDLLRPDQAPPPAVGINPEEDLAVLQYTGGTTGFPKGAMLTHYNLVVNVEMIKEMLREWIKKYEGEHTLSIALLPFFHSYGMTCCMNAGLTMPAGQILVPQFNADLILNMVQQYKPVLFPAVPSAYIALMNHPEADQYGLESIDVCISGAAPMPVEALEQFEKKTGSSILEGYGLSETSPVTHSNPFIGVRKPGSVGMPYPDTDCKIVDLETGEKEVPIGEAGELIIKGPQVMKGYWHRPDETARALRNGWLYTGDVAKMDEDGYFYIVDRKKDMIIYGGYKIYPREVEEVLYENPKVAEAICIGVPEKYFGEVVKAFVVLKSGAEATPEEMIDFCKKRLAKFKVPQQVEFRGELPKSMVGKILRRELTIEEQRKRKQELLEKDEG